MPRISASQWDQFLANWPQAHLLQTSAWAALKKPFGWDADWVQSADAGAQILFRRLPLGLSVAYIPKGPVGPDWATLWPEVDRVCRQHGAIFLKVEPDAWEFEVDALTPHLPGFIPAEPIQPRRTIVLDLSGSEADWLERMKQNPLQHPPGRKERRSRSAGGGKRTAAALRDVRRDGCAR